MLDCTPPPIHGYLLVCVLPSLSTLNLSTVFLPTSLPPYLFTSQICLPTIFASDLTLCLYFFEHFFYHTFVSLPTCLFDSCLSSSIHLYFTPNLPTSLPTSLPPNLPTSQHPCLPASLPPYLPTSLPPYLPTSLPP